MTALSILEHTDFLTHSTHGLKLVAWWFGSYPCEQKDTTANRTTDVQCSVGAALSAAQ